MNSTKVTACIALALLASGCGAPGVAPGRAGYDMGSDRFGPIPVPDPDRAISVQDCAHPLSLNGGNLMCR